VAPVFLLPLLPFFLVCKENFDFTPVRYTTERLGWVSRMLETLRYLKVPGRHSSWHQLFDPRESEHKSNQAGFESPTNLLLVFGLKNSNRICGTYSWKMAWRKMGATVDFHRFPFAIFCVNMWNQSKYFFHVCRFCHVS